jgi:hypothetical protein
METAEGVDERAEEETRDEAERWPSLPLSDVYSK